MRVRLGSVWCGGCSRALGSIASSAGNRRDAVVVVAVEIERIVNGGILLGIKKIEYDQTRRKSDRRRI